MSWSLQNSIVSGVQFPRAAPIKSTRCKFILDKSAINDHYVEMNEYVLFLPREKQDSNVSNDWQEDVSSFPDVTVRPTNMRGMVIKCDQNTAEQLIQKFPYLKIQLIIQRYEN